MTSPIGPARGPFVLGTRSVRVATVTQPYDCDESQGEAMANSVARRLEGLTFEGLDGPSVRATGRLLVEAVETGELPREAAFATLRTAAARAARDAVPLAAVLE